MDENRIKLNDAVLDISPRYRPYSDLDLYLEGIERIGERAVYVFYDPVTQKRIKLSKEAADFLLYHVEKPVEAQAE